MPTVYIWLAACLLPPVLFVLARFASLRVLLATLLVAWTCSTLATYFWLGRDTEDPVWTLLWYFALVLPMSTALPAGVIAARVTRPRGQVIPAVGVAMLGYVVGMIVLLLIAGMNAARLREDDLLLNAALLVALPTFYAACGGAATAQLTAKRV